MNRPGPAQWTAAGVCALALHATVLMAFLMQPPHDGAKAPGLGGISVALTMTAARAGSEADAREQQAETPKDITPADAVPAPPVELAPVPPQAAVDTAVPAPEAVTAFEPPPPVVPEAVAVTPPPAPLPVPKRRPPPAKPVVAKSAAEPTKTTAPAAQTVQKTSRAATASQGRQDAGRKGHSADAHDAVGGGPVGTPAPNYVNLLRYWLERNKTYPKDARRLRQQGVVNLYFRVTRDGRVLRHEIRKSSGHALLDGEAEAMLKRAQPLPKFTDDMKGGYLDVVVPVLFSLRGNS